MTPDGTSDSELAELLTGVRSEDAAARDRLVGLIYDDLRRAAARLMRRARPDHTLQPTALANEALARLLASGMLTDSRDREHLYRAAVLAMRRVLVDHHRHRNAAKGPGRLRRHPLDVVLDNLHREQGVDVESLDEALDRLAQIDPRACLVTTFHSFLGLGFPDVAEALEISLATAERDWKYARAWLRQQLRPEEEGR
ncbi:MAG: ECF-type sigma factor [Isosphaeraceae bacterium]